MSTSRFHCSLTWRGAFTALIGLVLLASSCSDTTNVTAIPHAKGCQSEADCDQGLTCTKRREALGGLCHVDCETTESCALGERCVHSDQASSVCQTAAESICVYDSDCFVPLICGPDQKCRDACKQDYDCIKPQKCTNQHVCAELNEVSASNELIMSFNVGPDGGRLPPDADGGMAGQSASEAGSGGTLQGGGPSGSGGTTGLSGEAGDTANAADAGESGAGGEPPEITGPRPNPCDLDSSTCNPLKVVLAGTGKGRVTSDPVGLDCGATCSAKFPAARAVVLTAIADQDSVFNGWSGGGCTGDRLCVVTPNAAPTITATFSPLGGQVEWVKALPKVTGGDAVFDRDGNAIISGTSASLVDLGAESALDAGTFVAKYTSAGQYLWVRHLSGTDVVSVLTSDAAGDVVFAGRGSNLALGSGADQISCASNLMIVKFSGTDGKRLWARCRPLDPNYPTITGFVVKPTRNGDFMVMSSGHVGGVGGHALQYSRHRGDNGETIWSQDSKGSAQVAIVNWGAFALDSEDNIITSGCIDSGDPGVSGDFGIGPVTTAGKLDGFIMKRTSAGASVWLKTFGDTLDDCAFGLTVDAQDNIAFAGRFQGQLDFGAAPLTSAGGTDVVAGKYSASGQFLWAKTFGGMQDDLAASIASMPNGDFVLAGTAQGSLDLDGSGPLFAPGKLDAFIVQLSGTDGSYVMSKGYGSPEDDGIGLLSRDAEGNLVFHAAAGGPIDFGNGLSASGGTFYVKMKL